MSEIQFEAAAREVAKIEVHRMAPWVLDESIPYQERVVRLEELLAVVAHDGMMLHAGSAELTDQPFNDDEKELLMAEHRGYMNGLTDTLGIKE